MGICVCSKWGYNFNNPLDHKKDCNRNENKNKKTPPKYQFFEDNLTEANSPTAKSKASAALNPKKKLEKLIRFYLGIL